MLGTSWSAFLMCLSFILSSENVRVPVSRRARFVGPGGYNLRRLQAQTGDIHVILSLNFNESENQNVT